MSFDPQGVVEILDEHGVEYVLIGGYAAQLHGATRPTTDIDITPSTTHENLGRLAVALRAMGAAIRVNDLPEGIPFDADATSLAAMQMLNLRTRFGDLDLTFHPAGTDGFADLARTARPRKIGSVTVRLAALGDIIRSKEAAGRNKDFEALPELHRLNQQATTED